jgi:hypothetical protein
MSLFSYLDNFPWGPFLGRGYGGKKPYNSRQRLVCYYGDRRVHFAGFVAQDRVGVPSTRWACKFYDVVEASDATWAAQDYKLPRPWATSHVTLLLGGISAHYTFTRTDGQNVGAGRLTMRELIPQMQLIEQFGQVNRLNVHLATVAYATMAQAWWAAQEDWPSAAAIRYCAADDGRYFLIGASQSGLVALQPLGHLSEVVATLANYSRSYRQEVGSQISVILSGSDQKGLTQSLADTPVPGATKVPQLMPFSVWDRFGVGSLPAKVTEPLVFDRIVSCLPFRIVG